jgi:hypothetical protein
MTATRSDGTAEPVPFLTDATGNEHLLRGEMVTIGRAIDNDIVITSKRVSREHARIRCVSWRVILEDANSTNGTFLNDERVLVPVDLRDGDRITIGGVTFVFHDPDITVRDTPLPELEIDVAAGVVRVDRNKITLSPKEFALLSFLYECCGQICSKDDIGSAVWPEYQDVVSDYQVENLVRRLRTKIEPHPGQPKMLLTVRGLGYKLMVRQ